MFGGESKFQVGDEVEGTVTGRFDKGLVLRIDGIKALRQRTAAQLATASLCPINLKSRVVNWAMPGRPACQ